MSHHDTHRTLTHLIRACDVVFGSTSILLAVLATIEVVSGSAPVTAALALWAVPVVNIAWSLATKHRDRVTADLVRGVVCIPLAGYIYASDANGWLDELWLPALMLSVAVCISAGIGTRRLRGSVAIAVGYAAALAIAGGDQAALYDSLGLLVCDVILSIVAVHLGRSLVEATARRDEAQDQRARTEAALFQLTERTTELTRAIADLQAEMERRMQLEAELAHAQKLESVGRLAAGIAHEINTPVQFVGDSLHFVRDGLTELLALAQQPLLDGKDIDLPYLVEELPKAIDRAEDGLGRVATIVRSMKVFAHPDADAMVPADLNRAIEATVVLAHNEYRYVADVSLELAPELPHVVCHVGELNQAVLNIVVNAAHAIGDAVGTSGERGRITVRTQLVGDDVVIAIGDSGPGMPDAVKARIFDPFFTTKPVGKGTGQGLPIARAVVEKHRGKLWCESTLGAGTTFFLRVPLSPEQAASAA